MSLDGKVAVVIGLRGNLGPVWTGALAAAGATVVGVDPAADGELEGVTRAWRGDVTDRASLDAARDEIVEAFGVPDVLVNSAGIDQPPRDDETVDAIEDIPFSEFGRVLEVNLAGTFCATQSFGSIMRDRGHGSIVNIGSLYAGLAPDPSFYDHLGGPRPFIKPPAYGASKAGVVAVTRYFARLWGPAGVRVNALSPGGVLAAQDDEFKRKYCARVPLGRMAETSDLTGPLVFLASEESRYVNGHNLLVDGGFSA